MTRPAQRGVRLLGALEDLVAQEAQALRAADYAAVAYLQERTGAILDDLAGQPESMWEPALRARLETLRADRAGTLARLETGLREVQEALRETSAARGRAARIAPAYGGPAAPAPRGGVLREQG